MCAIDAGRSIATTMGFTALDGLPMGTRIGSIDPGVILYLLQHEGMDSGQIEQLLYEQSGLLGVSAISSDMRTLLASNSPSTMRPMQPAGRAFPRPAPAQRRGSYRPTRI